MPFPLFATVLKVTVAVAVPVATALATRYASRMMDVRLAAERQNHIESLADSSILYSAQRYKFAIDSLETRQQKLEAATSNLIRNARKAGITLERDDAEYEIETALHRMRGRWPEELEAAAAASKAIDDGERLIEVVPAG